MNIKVYCRLLDGLRVIITLYDAHKFKFVLKIHNKSKFYVERPLQFLVSQNVIVQVDNVNELDVWNIKNLLRYTFVKMLLFHGKFISVIVYLNNLTMLIVKIIMMTLRQGLSLNSR
jgi:hypothetical protein